jgi:hypothetical protein
VRRHHREEKVELVKEDFLGLSSKRRLGEGFNKAWRCSGRKEQEKEQGRANSAYVSQSAPMD